MKTKQTVVIKQRKAKAPVDHGRIVLALQAMVAMEGWAVIVQICNANIEHLESAIIEKMDPETKAALTDYEVEMLRIKRGYLVELRDTPANYAKQLNDSPVPPEEFDPYFKSADDIIKARREKK